MNENAEKTLFETLMMKALANGIERGGYRRRYQMSRSSTWSAGRNVAEEIIKISSYLSQYLQHRAFVKIMEWALFSACFRRDGANEFEVK